jgi:hypothetical protein
MSQSKSLACRCTLFLLGLSISYYCNAEISLSVEESTILSQVQSEINNISTQGRWDVTLTGYAYHNSNRYTNGQMRALNNKAWGGGIGKVFRTDSGNDESLYAMVFQDSGRHLQWSAGYAYQWIFPVANTGLEIGAGLTAALISRHDVFNRTPFPALLPLASIGSKNIKLMATYVPPVSVRKGDGKKSKGDLGLVFIKFAFD